MPSKKCIQGYGFSALIIFPDNKPSVYMCLVKSCNLTLGNVVLSNL